MAIYRGFEEDYLFTESRYFCRGTSLTKKLVPASRGGKCYEVEVVFGEFLRECLSIRLMRLIGKKVCQWDQWLGVCMEGDKERGGWREGVKEWTGGR